jgi:hypothetical protein
MAGSEPDLGVATSNSRSSLPTPELLRRSLIGLAVLGGFGTALELGLLRHWTSALAVVPWISLALLALAATLLVVRPRRRRVQIARGLAAVVAASGLIGVLVHIRENYEAAPLDFHYTATWPTTPEPIRWLLAATDTVGPTPTLAPASLAFVAMALLFATLRHPVLEATAGGSAERSD